MTDERRQDYSYLRELPQFGRRRVEHFRQKEQEALEGGDRWSAEYNRGLRLEAEAALQRQRVSAREARLERQRDRVSEDGRYLLSRRSVSRKLGVSEGTLKRWEYERRGPPMRGSRYDENELEEWLLSDAPRFACSKRQRERMLQLRVRLARNEVRRVKSMLTEMNLLTKERPQ